MSRTYRRRGQRHEYRWLLRDSRWINCVLVAVFIDARSKARTTRNCAFSLGRGIDHPQRRAALVPAHLRPSPAHTEL
jgi:hypothetical protein